MRWTAVLLLALPSLADAAVVRGVRALASAGSTRIVVAVDGTFRFHSQASSDGRSLLVDIDGATLDARSPRLLPVSDERVDGVIVAEVAESGAVRVSVDLADRVAPRLLASVEAGTLVLDFVDAGDTKPGPAAVSVSDAERKHDGKRGQTPVKPVDKPVVILDPGHGGKDPGAKAWTGETEKDIVLDLAERVARRLRKRGDIEVVMTRSGDDYVTLADRRDASRRWGAAAFVSIHANASHNSAARGVETYFHSRIVSSAKGDAREIRRLARAENGDRSRRERTKSPQARVTKTPASTDAPLARANHLTVDRRADSSRLATLVQSELVQRLGMRYEAVDLGAKEGPFFVIGGNAAPSVLVEAAFLTHREEGLRMRSEVYREQIADGVARGIVRFLEQQGRAGAL